jgi:hypothetical protein
MLIDLLANWTFINSMFTCRRQGANHFTDVLSLWTFSYHTSDFSTNPYQTFSLNETQFAF